jgi:hypothetical protein
MRNFILKDAACRNTTQNPLIVEDRFFGHISKQDEEMKIIHPVSEEHYAQKEKYEVA